MAEREESIILIPPNKLTISLERRSTLLRSAIFILGFTTSEIVKQIANFLLTTHNHNKYPIPTALLIVFIEALKLFIILFYLVISRYLHETKFLGFSVKFSAPALCYFLTNLLYLYALTITSPPIWIILIQTRVLYTATIYKVVFNKPITSLQMIGCCLIVSSIFLTRLSEMHSGHLTIGVWLLIVSQISALLSSVACLVVEMLLKNDNRSFPEQQFWLYSWGVLFGVVALFSVPQDNSFSLNNIGKQISELRSKSIYLVFSIVSSALAGLCVPCIIKNLDTIVKDYVSALNNILLAFLVSLIFPTHFQINYVYGVSLVVLLIGILFYERKSWGSLISSSNCLNIL